MTTPRLVIQNNAVAFSINKITAINFPSLMEIIKKGVKSKTHSEKLSNSIKSKADKPEIVEKSVNLLSQLNSGAW